MKHYLPMEKVYSLFGGRVLNFDKIRCGVLTLAAICCLNISYAQTPTPESKKAAEIKRLEAALNTAKVGLARAEKQAATADSLITVGPQLISEGKSILKGVDAGRAAKEKEYKLQVKPLDKQMKSKDKEQATEAKNELKKVDTQFKADMKELDKKEKDALKKITTGENNKAKGKLTSKTSKESLKRAQATYDAAEEKLEAAKGGEEPVKSKSSAKKGKKK